MPSTAYLISSSSPPKVLTDVTPRKIITMEGFWSTKFTPIKSTWGTAERTREKSIDDRFSWTEKAESWKITSDYGTQRGRLPIEQTLGKLLSIPGPSEYSPSKEVTSNFETAPKVTIKSRPWKEAEEKKQSQKVPTYLLPKKSTDDSASVMVPWPQGPAYKGQAIRDPRRPLTPVPQDDRPGENLVGPGYYEPSISTSSTFETAPKISFDFRKAKASVPRPVIDLRTCDVKERHNVGSSNKDNPGVGAYTLEGTHDRTSNAITPRQVTIGEKREFIVGQPLDKKIPGPGQYDVYRAFRFGGPQLISPKSRLCERVSAAPITTLCPPSHSAKLVQRKKYVSQYSFPKKKKTTTFVDTNHSSIKLGE